MSGFQGKNYIYLVAYLGCPSLKRMHIVYYTPGRRKQFDPLGEGFSNSWDRMLLLNSYHSPNIKEDVCIPSCVLFK